MSPSGRTSTLAGNGTLGSINGPALASTFYTPRGIAVWGAGAGAAVYVADYGSDKIRVIANGLVSTLCGGRGGYIDAVGTNAAFAYLSGLALSPDGTQLYASESNQHVRRVVIASGAVTTVAGSGLLNAYADGLDGTSVSFNTPFGIATDALGNIAVADTLNAVVRLTDAASGATITLLGLGPGNVGAMDGSSAVAQFITPKGVAYDAAGTLYGARIFSFK